MESCSTWSLGCRNEKKLCLLTLHGDTLKVGRPCVPNFSAATAVDPLLDFRGYSQSLYFIDPMSGVTWLLPTTWGTEYIQSTISSATSGCGLGSIHCGASASGGTFQHDRRTVMSFYTCSQDDKAAVLSENSAQRISLSMGGGHYFPLLSIFCL